MKKVLVTGGAGYIGAHTCVSLVRAGYEPVILDNFSKSGPFILDGIHAITGKELVFYEGDCQDETLLNRILTEQGPIHAVMHFAAFKSVEESVRYPFKYYRNNLDAMQAVLAAILSGRIPHLVFSSSCTIYGEAEHLPLTEKSPRNEAVSPYGNSKRLCEDFIRDFLQQDAVKEAEGYKPQAVILRYFNAVGAHPSGLIGEVPEPKPNFLVPYIMKAVKGELKELVVYGNDYPTPDGTALRDYLHVEDLAAAHLAALAFAERRDKQENPAIFNLGMGRGWSVMEMIHAFEGATGEKVPFRIGQRRPGDISASYADASKAKTELGWKASHTIEEAMRDAWHWQQRFDSL